MNDPTDIFEGERQKLTSLCYRMLGDRASAEDAVQDTWLRWVAADHKAINRPSAWLRRVATNIAIDALKSARQRRETYVGPWLPEPLMPVSPDAGEPFELAQECQLALLWAMERLTEDQRAAFILREAFDAGYDEISAALGKSEATCRQLVSRSHKHLQESGPRFDTPPKEVEALITKFFAAATAFDHDTAIGLFAPNAVGITDGGRKARAARRILVGPDDIMHVLFSVWRKVSKDNNRTAEPLIVNQTPAIALSVEGKLDSIITLAPDKNGKIAWLYIMRNPDKLTGFAPKTICEG
ncbi:MAG: RNA polymerase sigma factor SigJ [Pseudomonadota bacterium]